jgi:hypothetical protein
MSLTRKKPEPDCRPVARDGLHTPLPIAANSISVTRTVFQSQASIAKANVRYASGQRGSDLSNGSAPGSAATLRSIVEKRCLIIDDL